MTIKETIEKLQQFDDKDQILFIGYDEIDHISLEWLYKTVEIKDIVFKNNRCDCGRTDKKVIII